jgi:hypothetical protein
MVSPDRFPSAAYPGKMDATVLPAHRPPSAGDDDPGTTPPRAGTETYQASTETRLRNPPAGEHAGERMVTDRGPHRRIAAKGGSGETPEGQRLAPDTGHRVDTDRGSEGLSLVYRGDSSGGGI